MCDSVTCEDESSCNGKNYGLWCGAKDRDYNLYYVPPILVCAPGYHCGDAFDNIDDCLG